jgi:PAS domain S-box-containing protein
MRGTLVVRPALSLAALLTSGWGLQMQATIAEPKEGPLQGLRRRVWQRALPSAQVAALCLVGCLCGHLAYAQYAVRRHAIATLTGDAQARAAGAALFLNDRRNDLRSLLDSGVVQRQASGADSLERIGASLRDFGRDHRFGGQPCFAFLVFISKGGVVRSESVPGAPPVRFTLGSLRSLARNSYMSPTFLIVDIEGPGDALVLSVAVLSEGVMQGQLLAVLNPELVDSRLEEVPGLSYRAAFLVARQNEVYASRNSPVEWRDSVAALSIEGPSEAVPVRLSAVPGRWAEAVPALAARVPLPTSEFSLVCVEPAAAIPTVAGIVRTALLYLLSGALLLALVYRLSQARPVGVPAESLVPEPSRCFQALFEHLPDGLLVADLDGQVRCLNRAMRLRNDIEAQGPCDRPLKALLGEVVDEADRGVLNRALQGRQPWFGRMRSSRTDGTPLTTDTALLPVLDAESRPTAVLALQRDVTAEIQAADRLRQAQKMEAVGVLTDGIAHDFNNLLTVIQGNCSLLLVGADSLDTFARDNIDEILRACDRAAAMTQRLLSFSRHKGIQLEVVDLNEVVGSIEKMLARLIRENIDMNVILADEPVLVKADIVQLEQVIINLTVNARDAMPRGGRLAVRVGRRAITTRALGTNLEEGDYAVLALEDTGHGMDEATRRRIFEPFFTTKSEREGTGLGLTTVQSIVRDHGGAVTVQSQVGLGTVFTVWLPLHTPLRLPPDTAAERTSITLDVDTEVNIPAPEASGLVPSETGILLLDDEESVLRMTERGLVAKGFKVFTARTDVEVLTKWEEHRDEIDLLITDMVMPGMSGIEVAQRLRQDRPDLKVLSISAYTDTVIMKLGSRGSDDMFFLQKPFTPDVLIAKVEHMLAVRPPPKSR